MMQFTPDNFDIESIVNEVSSWIEVNNMHHIHIWQINEYDIMFEAHLDLEDDLKITEFEIVLNKIKKLLHDKHEILHITIQPEFSVIDNKQIIHN